ncbi:MAG: hypothetical protein IKB20_01000 [Clostridia bacterium]|nr:hypothetical protein [Clostridia bacterium]
MNAYLFISTPVKGLLWCILLFLLCLAGVHIARLAQMGWEYQSQKRKPDEKTPPPPEKKAPAEKPQEPIYYIVERKTRKAKPTYSEPKPIQFRKGD